MVEVRIYADGPLGSEDLLVPGDYGTDNPQSYVSVTAVQFEGGEETGRVYTDSSPVRCAVQDVAEDDLDVTCDGTSG